MRFVKNYALGIILAVMFLGSWAGQYYFQLQEFKADAKEHSQPVVMSEFHDEFWSKTFENWQSEAWQVFWFIFLTKFFIFKGSAESRDSEDEIKAQLDRIEKRLNGE